MLGRTGSHGLIASADLLLLDDRVLLIQTLEDAFAVRTTGRTCHDQHQHQQQQQIPRQHGPFLSDACSTQWEPQLET